MRPGLILRLIRLFNSLLCDLSYDLRLPVSLGKVRYAILEMSSNCSLRCPLCTTGGLRHTGPNRKRGQMSVETFQRSIDLMMPFLRKVLFYTWGEPFINKNLAFCVRHASQRGIDTVVSTNMQLYNEQQGQALIESGLSQLIVSCDGLTQEGYEVYRTGGDLAKVTSGVKNLLELKRKNAVSHPKITMQFVVFKHNIDEMDAFQKYWGNQGVDVISFIPMSFMSKEGEKKARKFDMIPAANQWAPYHPYGKMKSCRELYTHVSIDWDGEIYTCCFPCGDKDYSLGNIWTESLDKIWNGPKYRYFRRHLVKGDKEPYVCETMCHDCTGQYPKQTKKRYW